MSRWGYQNFESDTSLDVLGSWLEKICDEIDEIFAEDETLSSFFYDVAEAGVVSNVELLCVLSETYKTYPELEIEKLENWRSKFLKLFDETDFVNKDFIEKRRKIIVDTFDRLKKILEEGW